MNRPSVYNFDNPVKFLNAFLSYLRHSDHSFSLNKFSKKIGVAATKLREIMKEKREFKMAMASCLQKEMNLDPSEFFYLQVLIKQTYARPEERAIYDQLINQLNPGYDHFRCLYQNSDGLYSHWLNMAILSLSDAKVNLADIDHLKSVLWFDVPKEEIEKALNLLTSLKILTIFDDGSSVVNFDRVTTKSDQRDVRVDDYYQSVNQLSNHAIHLPLELREFQLFTTNLDHDQIPLLKNILRETRNRIAKLSSGKIGGSVFQLNLQAFPLTGTVSQCPMDASDGTAVKNSQ